MFGLKQKEKDIINAAAHVAVIDEPRPPAFTKPNFSLAKRTVDGSLDEYTAVAKEIGLATPNIIVETFLGVMERLNLPIYSREEVVTYMDKLAARDGTGYGWEWRPVRDKDHIPNFRCGRPSGSGFASPLQAGGVMPASDYYQGRMEMPIDSTQRDIWIFSNMMSQTRTPLKYDKTIPLHALKRIAAIEKEYDGPAHFLVSDYATQPHARPDPFLMVVLPNVPQEMGRFVIDFWDEPGFGIDQMLAK